ncbi:hypothetical protein [Aquibacillus albus]|uniref:hypothetical protein n=1 Tax=Aquibacillus albus TaxID=1168171 RepID=UPI001958ABC4|nr:hypothetical protein [Aquibacillus albus]
MKKKIIWLLVTVALLLTACGQSKLEESLTLLNQNEEEVTFPQEKPILFFFITTYT